MSARLSPLRAFRATRSPLSLRQTPTRHELRTYKSSPGAALLDDLNQDVRSTPANRNREHQGFSKLTQRLAERSSITARRNRDHKSTLEQADENTRFAEMLRLNRREWQLGDVYAPHDLSAAEARKWKKKQSPSRDVFDQLGLNPLNEWKNPSMMFEFQTSAGRIKQRKDTGLRPVNQRKIAKAIRRGIGMGFLPSVHAHPELLRRADRSFFSY